MNSFYKDYITLKLDRDVKKLLVENWERELQTLIGKSSPRNVQGISFEQLGSSVLLPEMDIIRRINELTVMIAINKTILQEQEKTLTEIGKEIQTACDKLDSVELKVFNLAYVEGVESFKEIADVLGYELYYIYNKNVDIRKKLNLKGKGGGTA